MTLGGKIMLKKIATFFVVWAIVIFVYLLVFSIIERLKWKTTRKVVITVDDNELCLPINHLQVLQIWVYF